MKLRTLQIITLATSLATVAISISGLSVIQRPGLDVKSRPVVPWVPPEEAPQPMADAQTPLVPTTTMLERPLFQPDRRPFQPPPPPEIIAPPVAALVEPVPPPPAAEAQPLEAPAIPVAAPLNATLKGVLMTDTLDKAHIVTPDAPDGGWFTVGSEISGWKLTRIKHDEVTLVSGEQTQVLQLYVDNPAMPVGNAAPAN